MPKKKLPLKPKPAQPDPPLSPKAMAAKETERLKRLGIVQ